MELKKSSNGKGQVAVTIATSDKTPIGSMEPKLSLNLASLVESYDSTDLGKFRCDFFVSSRYEMNDRTNDWKMGGCDD